MTKPPGTRLPSSTLPRSNQGRDGELDPRAVDQNFREVERQLRQIPQVRGDRPPVVDLLLGQENRAGVLWGTMTVVVRDEGENFDGFVRFAKTNDPGPFDHSDPEDTGVWNQTDSTLPYYAEVQLSPKHGGLIAVGVPYRTFSEPDVTRWVIRQHRFDADWDAELAGHELAFDTNGYPLLSLTGDEDVAKHYVNMTVGDDVAGATPADPTAVSKDATLASRTGKLRFDGTGGVANKQSKMGKLVGYKVVCENADAIVNPQVFGPFFKRRGDSKTHKPTFHVTAIRSGSTVTVTVSAIDPSLALTALEFRKQDGGGSLAGAFVSTWDSTTGTIATDESIVRAEDVSSPPGLAAKLIWRGTWTDEFGNSQFIGDEIDVSHLEAVTKTIKFPHTLFMPAIYTGSWAVGAGQLAPGVNNVEEVWYGALIFPPGVVVTDWVMRASRADAVNDVATLVIRKISDSGGTASTIATLTHSGTGYNDTSNSTDETVSDDHTYIADLRLKGFASFGDALFNRLECTYSAPSYDKTY